MKKYPFVIALVCLVFAGLGLGAVLDPTPQDLLPKLTGSAALIGSAATLWYLTDSTHTRAQRRATAAIVLACGVLVPLIWLVR